MLMFTNAQHHYCHHDPFHHHLEVCLPIMFHHQLARLSTRQHTAFCLHTAQLLLMPCFCIRANTTSTSDPAQYISRHKARAGTACRACRCPCSGYPLQCRPAAPHQQQCCRLRPFDHRNTCWTGHLQGTLLSLQTLAGISPSHVLI